MLAFWKLSTSLSKEILLEIIGEGPFDQIMDRNLFGAFQVPIKSFLLEIIGEGPFGPNPDQEFFWSSIFGVWQPYRSRLKVSFWTCLETAILGQILASVLLELDFCILAAFRFAIKSFLLEIIGEGPFGPNHG